MKHNGLALLVNDKKRQKYVLMLRNPSARFECASTLRTHSDSTLHRPVWRDNVAKMYFLPCADCAPVMLLGGAGRVAIECVHKVPFALYAGRPKF